MSTCVFKAQMWGPTFSTSCDIQTDMDKSCIFVIRDTCVTTCRMYNADISIFKPISDTHITLFITTVKPILRNPCRKRPPILKNCTIIFLSGHTFQCNWTCPQTTCLKRPEFLWTVGWSFKKVLLYYFIDFHCTQLACSFKTSVFRQCTAEINLKKCKPTISHILWLLPTDSKDLIHQPSSFNELNLFQN